jgi:hypothetical protein
MGGLRISLWHLLALVALVAVTLGALAASSGWTASIAVTLFLALNCLALAGSIMTSGRTRLFWLAVAIFGWAYWWQVSPTLLWTLPNRAWQNMSYMGSFYYPQQTQTNGAIDLISQQLLDAAEPILARRGLKVGDTVVARWQGGGFYQGTIKQIDGSVFLIAWTDGSTPTSVARTDILSQYSNEYHRTGMAALGIFFALFGGMTALAVFGGDPALATADPAATLPTPNLAPANGATQPADSRLKPDPGPASHGG